MLIIVLWQQVGHKIALSVGFVLFLLPFAAVERHSQRGRGRRAP